MERFQFLGVDIGAIALGKAEKENREFARAIGDKRPVAAASPLPRAPHALFENAATKISIDQAPNCSINRLNQARVCYPLPGGEFGEELGFKYALCSSPVL